VPGLNGFVGEFLILIGSFDTARWWTVVATAGVILAAVYLLWAYQRVFHGEPDEDNSTFAELKVKEAAVLLPFLAAIVFLGVYPKPVLDRIEPSIDRLMVHVADNSSYEPPQVGRQRAEAPAHGSDEGEGGEGGDDSDEGTHGTDGPGGDGG
jgi:NADH-quinone oxidoreductase subunit M